jgi:hypothetical protein
VGGRTALAGRSAGSRHFWPILRLSPEIIEILKWTPVRAVGSNLEFQGDESDIARVCKKCQLPSCGAPDDSAIEQRAWHVAFRRPSNLLNVQVSDGKDGAQLSINIHTDIKSKRQIDGNDLAVSALKSFFPDLIEATSLVETLLETELSYAKHSIKQH